MKFRRQLLTFVCTLVSIISSAQYTIDIGGDIQLYAPASRDSNKPDLYDVKWRASGTGSVTLITDTSNPVMVRGVSAGTVTVFCSARYYNKAKWTDPMYSGYIYENDSYTITVKDSGDGGNEGGGNEGGGNEGGGTGGGGTGGGGSDDTFFQAKTVEGHSMWFYTATFSDGTKGCIVSPGLHTKSCVSQSTEGKVTIPETANGLTVRNIDNSAFGDITGITEIVIPKTVKYLAFGIIMGCSGLKKLTVLSENPPSAESNSFDYTAYLGTTLYVPQGSRKKYMEAEGWKEFEHIKEIGVEYAEIPIDATNFPDENFRNYLLEQKYGKDGVISEDELEEVTTMDIDSRKIENLKGLEFFTALTSLYCSGNKLNSLDVSKNTALQYLDCSSCQLTELNVSRNTALTNLDCSFNKLTSLDLSNNIALINLYCYYNQIKGKAMDDLINSLPYNYSADNYIIRIRLNPNADDGNVCTTRQVAALKAKGWTPYCSYSDPQYPFPMSWREYEGFDDTAIAIDATNFPDDYFRQYLLGQNYGKDGFISENEIDEITVINVSGSYDSYGSITNLQGIEYFKELQSLCCFYNKLTSLDVSRNTALTNLDCDGNQLTSLDVSKNTALTNLNCGYNQLTSLDVSSNTALTSLSCHNNQLTSLDVSSNTALTSLSCHNNQLTSLDVSRNTALTNLDCSDNKLTSLDVSRNTALTNLDCGGNQLTSLDVSRNTALTNLNCYRNQLKSLDVSKNPALTSIYCYRNQFKDDGMDDFIYSLPNNYSSDEYKLHIVANPATDGNVCTTTQVAAIKSKGWTPYYYDSGWKEYAGSDPTPEQDNQKIKITIEVKNQTDEDVNWLKMKLLLNTEMSLSFWASEDHITYKTIKPGYSLELNLLIDRDNLGLFFAGKDMLKLYNYNSNFVIYDENNSIMTYVTENKSPSQMIVDGGIYYISIVKNRNTNSINPPQYIEDASNAPIYSLNGQRLEKPRKGINIIGGKKVVVK